MFQITSKNYEIFKSFKFKNLKHFNTHDGVAYSCELYHNSVKIADVYNDGNGGDTNIKYFKDGENYFNELNISEYQSKDIKFDIDNEYMISDLIEVAIMIKKALTKQSKSVVYIKNDDVYNLRYKYNLSEVIKNVGVDKFKNEINDKVIKEGGVVINTNLEKLGVKIK